MMKNSQGKNRAKPFARPRILIVGCGDIGMRLLPLLRERFRVFAVIRQESRRAEVRAAGAVPIVADLDSPASLGRIAGLAHVILHLAPPQSTGDRDCRTRNLTAILPERATVVYASTTGVYGDRGGALLDEASPVSPMNARAVRRVDAEQVLRAWARRSRSRVAILRVPGIYAAERLPLDRLRNGTPALRDEDDVFTNHIHADDLARIVLTAATKGAPSRVYHAVDDSVLKMGQYFDAVADAFMLPRAPRVARAVLAARVSPMLLSFMSESRRLSNFRMKTELGVRLRYSTVEAALESFHPG